MLPNIPAVHVDDGLEYSGWLDLNKFLADPDSLEHWQVLYCLLWHQEFLYQGVRMVCPKPQLLRNWLQRWADSPVGKKMAEHHMMQIPLQGLHPMTPPSSAQLAQYFG